MYLLNLPEEILLMLMLFLSENDRFAMLRVNSVLRQRLEPLVRNMYMKGLHVPPQAHGGTLAATPLPNLTTELGLVRAMMMRNVMFTQGRKIHDLFYPVTTVFLGSLTENVFTFGCTNSPVMSSIKMTDLGTVYEAKTFQGFTLEHNSPYNKYRASANGRFVAIMDNHNVGLIDITFRDKNIYEYSRPINPKVPCVDFGGNRFFLFDYDSKLGFVEIKYRLGRPITRHSRRFPARGIDLAPCSIVDAECLDDPFEECYILLVQGCPRSQGDKSKWCHYGIHKFAMTKINRDSPVLSNTSEEGHIWNVNGQILDVKAVKDCFLLLVLGYEEEQMELTHGKPEDLQCMCLSQVIVRLNEITVIKANPRTNEVVFIQVQGSFTDVNSIRVDYLMSLGLLNMWKMSSVQEFYSSCRKVVEYRWAANDKACVMFCKGKFSYALLKHPGVRGKLMRRRFFFSPNLFPSVDVSEFLNRQCRMAATKDGFVYMHQKENALHFVSILPKLSVRIEKDEENLPYRICQVTQYTDILYEDV